MKTPLKKETKNSGQNQPDKKKFNLDNETTSGAKQLRGKAQYEAGVKFREDHDPLISIQTKK